MTDSFSTPITPQTSAGMEIVRSIKEFSDTLTLDLTDDEIARTFKILLEIISKWQKRFRARIDPNSMISFTDVDDIMKAVDEFEDEVKTRLAEDLNILASVDVMPVIEGTGYPTIVIEGALSSHSSASYGFDHERKQFEVIKAKERGEVFLGADNVE